jgi:hypothetical protein
MSSNPVVRIDACRLGGGDDDGERGERDAEHPMNAAIRCETTVGELRESRLECARERRHRALLSMRARVCARVMKRGSMQTRGAGCEGAQRRA